MNKEIEERMKQEIDDLNKKIIRLKKISLCLNLLFLFIPFQILVIELMARHYIWAANFFFLSVANGWHFLQSWRRF